MMKLFRLGSLRALLISSVLLPLLLVQQGSWLHALSHVPHGLIAQQQASDGATGTKGITKQTPPEHSEQSCLTCLAFSAGGHAAPLASLPTWQLPQLPMVWVSALATGRAVQAFLPYRSRAPPL